MAAGSENIESKVQSKLDLLLITSDPPENIDSIHIIIPQYLKVRIYESGTRDADKEQLMEWSNRIRDEFSDEMILTTIEKIEIRPVVKAPYRYDTLEHKKIGDEAFEAFYGEIRQQEGADLLPYPNSDISGYDENYPPMTFGSIVALAGDFFGIPDKPISEAKGKEAEKRFLDSTADLFSNKDRINLGLELLGIAYDHPFFIDAWYWWATRGKYIKLAQNNIDH